VGFNVQVFVMVFSMQSVSAYICFCLGPCIFCYVLFVSISRSVSESEAVMSLHLNRWLHL
jgi:hypothetical protein